MPSKPPLKHEVQVAALKNDCNLFSHLYISCQTRSGDPNVLFAHENQTSPPSLSMDGQHCLENKADLLDCLELEKNNQHAPAVSAKLCAVVQILNPKNNKNFQEYADMVSLRYVSNHLRSYS